MIEWSISLGSILQIVAMIGGGVLILVSMRFDVRNLKEDVVDMKAELRKVGEILTNQAVMNHRVQNIEDWRRELERRP